MEGERDGGDGVLTVSLLDARLESFRTDGSFSGWLPTG